MAAPPPPQERRSDDGKDGVEEEGVPFCGLFFPGVLLKFWVRAGPRGTGHENNQAVI